MSIEIERKFLVKNNSFLADSFQKKYIKQGFLNTDKHRIVRIRISDDTGYITIKGITNETGMSRFEWEKQIPIDEANQLLTLCEDTPIEKHRYLLKNDSFVFEVDVFGGPNDGLIIAEIELSSEKDDFSRPKWLGKEVTGQTKYYNSMLSKTPYNKW